MSEEETVTEQPAQKPVYQSVVIIGGNAMFRSQSSVIELAELMRGIMATEHRIFAHRDDETGQHSILAIPQGAMVEVMSMQRLETVQNERRIAALRQQSQMQVPPQIMRPGRG